jgi:predicted flap endonuclease-1-like 5' DNA nuclease
MTAMTDDLRARLAEREQQAADCQASLQSKTAELTALSQELASVRAELAALGSAGQTRAQTISIQSAPAGVSATPVKPDPLRKIEGIGPKIESILHEQGILTFRQLASTSPERLDQILEQAGPRFRLADPSTWPAQARLAAEQDWEALKKLQDELSGGRDTDRPRLTQ